MGETCREMGLIKKIKIAVLVLVLLLVSCFCTGCTTFGHRTINEEYKEWEEYLEISELEVLKKSYYSEEDGLIVLSFEHILDQGAVEELISLVSKHNEFIEENPNYFQDKKFIFGGCNDQCTLISFSSYYTEDDSVALGRTDDDTLQYLTISYKIMYNFNEISDLKVSVPVLIMERHQNSMPGKGEAFGEFLEIFPDTEQVIFDVYNYEKLEEKAAFVKEILPEAEIYEANYGRIVEHYEE